MSQRNRYKPKQKVKPKNQRPWRPIKCYLCQEMIERHADKSKDHIIPKSDKENADGKTRPSHKTCNNLKGSKPLAQYLDEQDKLFDFIEAESMEFLDKYLHLNQMQRGD